MPTFEFRQYPMRYVTNNVLLHAPIYIIYIFLLYLYIIFQIFADQSLIIE